jgi:hypothetical protein
MPTFHAYQHRDHAHVLEQLRRFFGCGFVRPKGPSSSVLTYSVQVRRQLLGIVIPFFERHPLVIKAADFATFATIVRSLAAKEHLEREGFVRLVRLAYGMNGRGKQRSRPMQDVLGSSETVRQAPALRGEDTVRPTWRHVESGRNDLTAQGSLFVGVTTSSNNSA